MKKIIISLFATLLVACSKTTQTKSIVTPTDSPGTEKTAQSTPETTTTSIPDNTHTLVSEAITYTGSGDDVIEIETFNNPWYLHIEGNENLKHFAVKGYDENDNNTKLFINTTEAYVGDVLDPYQSTKTLEIKSSGEWSITVASIFSRTTYGKGDTISGSGDSLIVLKSSISTINAIYKGKSNFVVKEYTTNGTNLLINEIGTYNGKVKSSGDSRLIEINSSGDWEFTLN